MGIRVFWDNPEKTILVQKFEGKWTGADYLSATEQMSALLAGVDYRIHLVGDMTESVGIPALNLLAVSGRVIEIIKNHALTVTIVKADSYYQAIVNMVRRLNPHLTERIYFVSTLDQAYKAISQSPK